MLNNFLLKVIECFKSLRPTTKTNTQEIILSPDIYVAHTDTPKSRGVFANRHFKKGEIVEYCPLLIIEEPLCELSEQLKLIGFEMVPDTSSAIALGFGSLYRQDGASNMRCEVKTEQPVLVFTTVRSVEKDEELTVDYHAENSLPLKAWVSTHLRY